MTQQLLMIEDDNRLAAMVGDYLRQSGYGFTHAADGMSGLAALDNSEPDLVILDLMLPDMDGLEVCRRIKSRSAQGDKASVAERRAAPQCRAQPGQRAWQQPQSHALRFT
jgi:DNA-binding response OmpR family regulator